MLKQYDDILTIYELAEIMKIGITQAYRLALYALARLKHLKLEKTGKYLKMPLLNIFVPRPDSNNHSLLLFSSFTSIIYVIAL